ncbi:MAG: patatin family protein [Lachnospiraceae bacterium]|nr:patatin family protein [Lachnospiraceae bacterium]
MKTGLVLEGGAMRGMFTAGVLDVLMEQNIEVDGVIGVSAGATFGCNYKSKQIGRTIRYNMKYCNDPRYCSFRSLLKTGDLFGAEFCYHTLPEQLDLFDNETYETSPMEFYMVTTDVNTGKPVYYKCDKFDHEGLEWVRASASMPLVSRIVEVGGRQMLDGGISDSIPLQYFQSIGYNKNLVILTQPRDYVKKENKLLPLMKLKLKQYPKLLETMKQRHIDYNDTLEYIRTEEQKGTCMVLSPKEKLPVGRIEHKPERLKAVYDIGRETALEHLEEIKNFLQL